MSEENKTKFENSEERLKRFGEKLRQQNQTAYQNKRDLKDYSKESDSYQLI